MGKRHLELYQFLDHQSYLRAWHEDKLAQNPGCSLQWLANQLNVKSKGHVHRMLHHATRPMSMAVMERWIVLLELSGAEAEYFRALVTFSTASKPEDRARSFETMRKTLVVREAGKVLADRYDYLSCWWLPALRELATAKDWKGDTCCMAKRFLPPLSEAQVNKGLELLLRTGLLVKEGRTRFRQTEAVLRTDADVLDVAIYNYHKEQLERSRKALELPLDERELVGITFGLPRGGFERIRERTREFQQSLLAEFGSLSNHPEEIIQWNLQMFHLTKPSGSAV